MSTVSPTPTTISSQPAFASLPLHKITVDEYERIGAARALEEPARVELIDGNMVAKMPKSPEHSWATKETLKMLDNRLPPGWTSQKEEPIRIPAYDEPVPDIEESCICTAGVRFDACAGRAGRADTTSLN